MGQNHYSLACVKAIRNYNVQALLILIISTKKKKKATEVLIFVQAMQLDKHDLKRHAYLHTSR